MPKSRPYQPRKTPQQERSRLTRDRILRAAARVFGEHGYAATTTDGIAGAAELSIGSLYQYFPNKDAVLHTLAEAHIAEADEAIGRALVAAADGVGYQGWLSGLVTAVIGVHAADPALQRVMFDEAPRSTELIAAFQSSQFRATTAVEKALRADPELDLDDPARTALFLIATIESLTHRFVGSESIRSDEVAAEIVKIVTAYLLAQPDIQAL